MLKKVLLCYSVIDSHLHIQNKDITFSNKAKYLGVIFESNLKFKAHIEKVYVSNCKYSGLSYRLSGYFSLTSAKSFYYAFFYSSVTYCISVWGGMLLTTSTGLKLSKLQKRIVVNLFSKFSPMLHYNALLKQFELLKIEDVYRLKAACIMFNLINVNDNHFLENHLNLVQASHSYPTRNSHLYIEPFPRVECIRLNFKYQFISIWNSVPINIKQSNSSKVFKNSYKSYLLLLY